MRTPLLLPDALEAAEWTVVEVLALPKLSFHWKRNIQKSELCLASFPNFVGIFLVDRIKFIPQILSSKESVPKKCTFFQLLQYKKMPERREGWNWHEPICSVLCAPTAAPWG
jgi:hypothetical protein